MFDAIPGQRSVSIPKAPRIGPISPSWTKEWNYYWRTNPDVVKYIQVVEGLFIGEIISRLQATQDDELVRLQGRS
jgi:hypothetical protein